MTEAPPSKGQRTRQRILDAAFGLFAQRGYAHTTVRDIAKAAGCSPGLLYRYFPSREALAIALYESVADAADAQLADLAPGSLGDRFAAAMGVRLTGLVPHRDAFIGLLGVSFDPRSEASVLSPATAYLRDRGEAGFRTLIEGSSDRPRSDDVDVANLARILYVLHLGVLLVWTQDPDPQGDNARKLVDFIAAALRLGTPFLAAAQPFTNQLATLISAFLDGRSGEP